MCFDLSWATVYANAIQDNLNVILYPGLIEELVDIIEISDNYLVVRYFALICEELFCAQLCTMSVLFCFCFSSPASVELLCLFYELVPLSKFKLSLIKRSEHHGEWAQAL